MSVIGFIGGTGPEGKGLAMRFCFAGHDLIIGSRSVERAQEAAKEITGKAFSAKVRGASNEEAAREAEIIVLTVPYSAQKGSLGALADVIGEKVVVSTAVPLTFDKGRPGALIVEEGSAAEQAQTLLPRAKVVGAFHNLSAHKLLEGDTPLDMDILVCGDDGESRQQVMRLAEQLRGCRSVDAGPLAYARFIEDITALLLNLNKRYKAHAGIRIVGV